MVQGTLRRLVPVAGAAMAGFIVGSNLVATRDGAGKGSNLYQGPVLVSMPKVRWSQSENIFLMVMLKPPENVECVFPWITNTMLYLAFEDDEGRPAGWYFPFWQRSGGLRTLNIAAVHRELLDSLSFKLLIHKPRSPSGLGEAPPPGKYRLYAVYDARPFERRLAYDESRSFFDALAPACGLVGKRWRAIQTVDGGERSAEEVKSTELSLCSAVLERQARDKAFDGCLEMYHALAIFKRCAPPRKFMTGPYRSNVVEFEIVASNR